MILKILIENKKLNFYKNQRIHLFQLVKLIMNKEVSMFYKPQYYIKMFLMDNSNNNMIQI